MAIQGISISSASMVQPAARTQPIPQAKQDSDGDNDGSRVGEVESQVSTSSTSIGRIINTTA